MNQIWLEIVWYILIERERAGHGHAVLPPCQAVCIFQDPWPINTTSHSPSSHQPSAARRPETFPSRSNGCWHGRHVPQRHPGLDDRWRHQVPEIGYHTTFCPQFWRYIYVFCVCSFWKFYFFCVIKHLLMEIRPRLDGFLNSQYVATCNSFTVP